MAISTRRKRFTNAMAALSLLASFSYEPCRAFVATRSLTLQQDRRRSGVVNTSNLFIGRKTCSYRGVEVRGCRVPSSRATSMLAPPPELWSSYLQALEVAPLLTKSITAGAIFPAADAVAQFVDNDNNKGIDVNGWDFARTFRWLFFGFAVQAPWNHFFYVLLDGALPPTPEPFSATTGIKVFIDQFVQAPVFTVVIFGVLGLLEGKTAVDIREKLNRDYKSTMIANWGVFVPAAVVNLAFCPPELRVLFLNLVFFGWTIFLSTVVSRGAEETVGET